MGDPKDHAKKLTPKKQNDER